jgi:hypothetical protein
MEKRKALRLPTGTLYVQFCPLSPFNRSVPCFLNKEPIDGGLDSWYARLSTILSSLQLDQVTTLGIRYG